MFFSFLKEMILDVAENLTALTADFQAKSTYDTLKE